MYNEDRKPTQRELDRQQLQSLWSAHRKHFYSLEKKDNADILWAEVGNLFVGLGHWYGNYRVNNGFRLTFQDVTELEGKSWPTAEEAYQALVEWAGKHGKRIQEQEPRAAC